MELILNRMAMCLENSIENQKSNKGVQDTWKSEETKRVSRHESEDRSKDMIFRLQDLHKIQMFKYYM